DASSTYQDSPEYRPSNLLDGNPRTLWIARPPDPLEETTAALPGQDPERGAGATHRAPAIAQVTDAAPSVTLTWPESREVDQLKLGFASAFSTPSQVVIRDQAGEERRSAVEDDGTVHFDPLEATSLTLSFPDVNWHTSLAADGSEVRVPLALADV